MGPFCIEYHSPFSPPGWSHEKHRTHCNVDLVGWILWPIFSALMTLTLLISPAQTPLTTICVWLAHAWSSDLKYYLFREAQPHELLHMALWILGISPADMHVVCWQVHTHVYVLAQGGPICLVTSIWPVPLPALKYLLKRWSDYLWALPPMLNSERGHSKLLTSVSLCASKPLHRLLPVGGVHILPDSHTHGQPIQPHLFFRA